MPSLDRDLRKKLEKAVVEARKIAEAGAIKALRELAVQEREAYPSMTEQQRGLRNRLRAHGRQLGDKREAQRGTQTLDRLKQACAYEHWHRMLFARFLAENELLLEPESQVSISLDDCRELAREMGRDWLELAAEYAQKMLLEVFRADDPVLEVALPPETQQQLEATLEGLDAEVFTADDSLGWVYQFWQKEEKERIDASGDKIGANELAPVTQLFTEDYMVLFLLENTLGAWWTAKRRAEGKDPALPGYEWTYLRLNEDGTPAAGAYAGWPQNARELRVLDPCMGSGHFLTFALPILARMRVEEEDLSLEDALTRTLQDNLFGLELDARCSQIAAFNLALTAWRLGKRYFPVPEMNLACSGLGINAGEEDWVILAGEDGELQDTMRELYQLFRQAPALGSLIDPTRFAHPLLVATFQRVRPLLERALTAEGTSEEKRELMVAAKGVLATAQILTKRFSLVVTNVPYLGRGKQGERLKAYCEQFHKEAKADIATCFVDRCVRFCAEDGSVALVSPQNWLFLGSYRRLRETLLTRRSWNAVAKLGPNAFQDMNWWAATTALTILGEAPPSSEHHLMGLDTSGLKDPILKSRFLAGERIEPPRLESHDGFSIRGAIGPVRLSQRAQRSNPDARIVVGEHSTLPLLAETATAHHGLTTGDSERMQLAFWELDRIGDEWKPFCGACDETRLYDGRSFVLRWHGGGGPISELLGARLDGQGAWGSRGVLVRQMRHLPATLYDGDAFDNNTAVVIPRRESDLLAIWAFISSPQYLQAIRQVDQKVSVTSATLTKVPFDVSYWQRMASQNYPDGLPEPFSGDPTQWLFSGHPNDADEPTQVAVARLVGYRWPRQAGISFRECPALAKDDIEEHSDSDGIVCLSSIAGEPAAERRLRSLLADAFGDEWSAQKLTELLGDSPSLKIWLRDGFFEEHCNLFHQRPFVWHIWDGRKDGFHALVDYHKLASPKGEGRRTLERLIYTSLGDWISRQRAEVASGADGAEARLPAAEHLQQELIKILKGEPPYDLFIRWKPLYEQPIGWEPDVNDGVRLNIRPWLQAKPYKPSRKNACILRFTPKIKHGKDRGKEPVRDMEDYPWFWNWDQKTKDFKGGDNFDGDRWNDLHYTHKAKQEARERQAAKGAKV